MAKESFLRGAFILAIASGISRILGVIYMVGLPRIILDEGMGLLQLVKPLHYFAVVLAISGMPTAISIVVSEKAAQGSTKGVMRVFYVSLGILLFTGALACIGLLASARYFTDYIVKDSGVYWAIIALAPSVLFYALGGALRGYFQGLQHMTPTAVSQVADQLIRVGATIGFALWLMPRGIEYAVAGVAFSFVVGEMVSVLILLGFYFRQKKSLLNKIASCRRPQRESWRPLIRRLARLALPIVLTTIIWPIMQMLDTLFVPSRMQAAGFSGEEIREWMGYLGMALTLCQFPNIITVALSTSLIPAISEAATLGSGRLVARRTEEALRIALLFGLPSFVGLFVLASPIAEMLFSYAQVGLPLRVLAIGTVTLGTIQATTGVLEGLGRVTIPVKNLLVGVVVKLILNLILTGLPNFGALGAAWGSSAGWLVVAVLNTYSVFTRVGFSIKLGDFLIKPISSAMFMGWLIYYSYDTLYSILFSVLGNGVANTIATLSSIGLGIPCYFLMLMMVGSITEKDIRLIPKLGGQLGNTLYYWGFLRK